MPLYMDIHNLPEGTTPEDVAKAHAKDMETQRKYGVEYTKYWVNDTGRKVFCLAHAPSAEAAEQVHREAHGMMPEKIIEVEPDVAEVFLGGTETSPAGAVLLPGGAPNERDPGIRTILFTDVVNSTTLTQSRRRRSGACNPGRTRRDRARCVVCVRRSRNKAHWGRHYGVIRLDNGRGSLRNSDPARIGQACASASESRTSAQGPSRRCSRRACGTT